MSKNTHLEHLEDSILLDGSQGAKDAFTFLDELAQTFSGKQRNNFMLGNRCNNLKKVELPKNSWSIGRLTSI